MRSNIVIKVDSLSKQYRLGNVGLGSLGADVNRFWQTKIRGKEDPYLKIGEENNRETIGGSEYVWALRDINFDVQQGEVLGIIGRNGAGKSTLLKILSRTTGPTTGSIKIKGRVASLLEVGTGFHPELTGRENVFLNGAILGMTKQEIKIKFDEIVDFAGVERYVDTPVKRYSSGMYVRLAFAVAAHLEPEILIVDEVLAVGDAEFQKKAIGKMKDVSQGEGRTVLFVSHNMTAIENLCPKSMLLQNGKILLHEKTEQVLNIYLKENDSSQIKTLNDVTNRQGTGEIRFSKIVLLTDTNSPVDCLKAGGNAIFRLHYTSESNKEKFENCRLSLAIKQGLQPLIVFSSELTSRERIFLYREGYIDFEIKKLPLSVGSYNATFFLESDGVVQDWFTISNFLNVIDGDFYGYGTNYPIGWQGKTVLVDHSIKFSDNHAS